ncbi:alpha/beta fold hydrolase [bacterium]|nr:alpha/beta fold hydrolase [bacterium]
MLYDYMISARKRQGNAFIAEPGPVQFIRVPRGAAAYDPSHVIPAKAWVTQVQGLADGDENPNSISPTGDVLVLVHGYNTTIGAAIATLDTLRANLRGQGWRGEIVSFDWPSGNNVLNYVEDRTDASAVARQLVDKCLVLLMQGQKAGCITNVHLLAHSTGAYVVLEAFAQAQKDGTLFKSDWRIGQVALIAGDISAESLRTTSAWSQPMFGRINRLTNYSNGNDAVLAVSNAKRLGVSPRVGRVGLPPDADSKAVNVDCTAHFNTLRPGPDAGFAYCHSWHFSDPRFGLDLALTLEGAIDRNAIPSRNLGPRGLWLNDDGQRPAGQSGWGIKDAAQSLKPRL